MKLLLDENLAPKLAKNLADIYPDSSHVSECGLKAASDLAVWEFAQANGFVIVSKDSDFEQRSPFAGFRPKSFVFDSGTVRPANWSGYCVVCPGASTLLSPTRRKAFS